MLTDYDTLSSLDIDELIAMKKNKEFLDKHPYAIWQSKDGKYWYTTLPDKTKERGVRQIRRNSKKELEDAIIEYWKDNTNKKTVKEVYEEWADYRLETKRIVESTYINVQHYFVKYFGQMADRYIDDIKPYEWCEFLEKILANNSLTRPMFGTAKSLVGGIVKWSYKHQYIDYTVNAITDLLDVSEGSFANYKKSDEDEVYSEKETPLIIEYLLSHQTLINLGILLTFITGLRYGELVVLKRKNFVGNVVQVRATLSVHRKENGGTAYKVKDSPKTTSGIRDVIVPKDFMWLIEYFATGEPEDYIFIGPNDNFIYDCTFNRNLKRICKKLDIPYRTMHKIRKTYGSILLDNNVNSRFVMRQMGHSNISCTENYYHKDREDNDKKTEVIDEIGKFYQT